MTSNQFDIEPYSRPLNDSFALGFKMQRVYFRCQKNKTQKNTKTICMLHTSQSRCFYNENSYRVVVTGLGHFTGNFFSETRTVMKNFQFLLDPKIFTRSMQKSTLASAVSFSSLQNMEEKMHATQLKRTNPRAYTSTGFYELCMSQTIYIQVNCG